MENILNEYNKKYSGPQGYDDNPFRGWDHIVRKLYDGT